MGMDWEMFSGLVSFILHHLNNTVTTKREGRQKHWLGFLPVFTADQKSKWHFPQLNTNLFSKPSRSELCILFFISYLETRTLSPQNNEEGIPWSAQLPNKGIWERRLLDLMHSFKCTLLKDQSTNLFLILQLNHKLDKSKQQVHSNMHCRLSKGRLISWLLKSTSKRRHLP